MFTMADEENERTQYGKYWATSACMRSGKFYTDVKKDLRKLTMYIIIISIQKQLLSLPQHSLSLSLPFNSHI